jgi:hypothetical protein
VVELKARQYFFVTHATTRVLVDFVDEFFNRVFTVAENVTRHTLGGSNEFAVHNQQTMVESFYVTLDDNCAAVFHSFLETGLDFLGRAQVDGNSAAMVARQRLEYDRLTNALRSTNRIGRRPHNYLLRYRQPKVTQDPVGLFLV